MMRNSHIHEHQLGQNRISHISLTSIQSILILLISSTTFAQSDFYQRLADSAFTLTKNKVNYDPSYFILKYPGGDIPSDKGVCTDVIIRAYRKLGIDLQQEVHEDMAANFDRYPKNWKLSRPDKNIDHRRVPNLQVFFSRKGQSIPVSLRSADYKPGDLVTWSLAAGIPHIGIVADRMNPEGTRPLIVHNIGAGQVCEDMLFDYKITGHYRFGVK